MRGTQPPAAVHVEAGCFLGGTNSGATKGRALGLGVCASGASPSGGQRNFSSSFGSSASRPRRASKAPPPATRPIFKQSRLWIIGDSLGRSRGCTAASLPPAAGQLLKQGFDIAIKG